MSLPALFAVAFMAALSGALMPGPVLFATLHRSAAHGRWAGPLIVAGHAIVELPLMVAIILGLGELLDAPALKAAVGLVGGLVLALMGASMLRGLPTLKLPVNEADGGGHSPIPALRVIASGAITSVSNPYFTIWWAGIGLNFIVHARPYGLPGYAVFYCGHILADLIWYAAVSESMHHGRRIMSDRAYRGMVAACAVLLVGFGVFFAWSGYGFARGTRGVGPADDAATAQYARAKTACSCASAPQTTHRPGPSGCSNGMQRMLARVSSLTFVSHSALPHHHAWAKPVATASVSAS